MGVDPVETAAALVPKRAALLGDIRVDASDTKPLGGLNPYNPYFDSIGKQFHRLLIDHAGLTNMSSILDVGCGTGRLAKQLQDHGGNYYGFDVNDHFVDYCRSSYKKGHFDCCDVRHDEYNPNGCIDPLAFEFP
jgi:2-polyprenyl-3-methyl-5-hydroxy-6-metoxy-1,4-benzoquinol methylase